MTKREYRNYSRLSFFFSVVFSGFLINALINGEGWKRLIFSLLFGVVVIMQLRLALLMRRKSQELDIK
jgi:biotin transporter BioY